MADIVPEVPGNIDLNNRPRVTNADGTISTVRSIGVNLDGKEILLPTVSDQGQILNPNEAINLYRRTGKHLGIFKSAEDSTRYAQELHNNQANLIMKDQLPSYDSLMPEKQENSLPSYESLQKPAMHFTADAERISPGQAALSSAIRTGTLGLVQPANMKAAEQQQPEAVELAGLGAGAVEGAGEAALGTVLKAPMAAVGAVTGGIQGYNAQPEAPVGTKLYNAAKGAAISAALNLAPAVLRNAPEIGGWLKNQADSMAAKMARLPAAIVKESSLYELRKLGEVMNREGITSKPGMLKTVTERAKQTVQRIGKEIGEAFRTPKYKDISVPLDNAVARIDQGIGSQLTSVEAADQVRPLFEDTYNQALKAGRVKPGPLTPNDMWELAKDFEEGANKWGRSTEAAAQTKAGIQSDIAGHLRDMAAEAIGIVDAEGAQNLKGLSSDYHALKKGSDAMQLQMKKEFAAPGSISVMSAPGKLMGHTVASAPMKTTTIGVADAVGRFLSKAPKSKYSSVLGEALKQSPQKAAAAYYVLRQTDPEFQKLAGEQENE